VITKSKPTINNVSNKSKLEPNVNNESKKSKSEPIVNNESKKSKPEPVVNNESKKSKSEPTNNNVVKTTEQVKKVVKNKPKPSEDQFDDEDDFVEVGKLKKDNFSTRGFTNDFIMATDPEPIK